MCIQCVPGPFSRRRGLETRLNIYGLCRSKHKHTISSWISYKVISVGLTHVRPNKINDCSSTIQSCIFNYRLCTIIIIMASNLCIHDLQYLWLML